MSPHHYIPVERQLAFGERTIRVSMVTLARLAAGWRERLPVGLEMTEEYAAMVVRFTVRSPHEFFAVEALEDWEALPLSDRRRVYCIECDETGLADAFTVSGMRVVVRCDCQTGRTVLSADCSIFNRRASQGAISATSHARRGYLGGDGRPVLRWHDPVAIEAALLGFELPWKPWNEAAPSWFCVQEQPRIRGRSRVQIRVTPGLRPPTENPEPRP